MGKPAANAPGQSSLKPRVLNVDSLVTAVFESAVEAFVRTILVMVFGSIALGITGSIWKEMAPSAPPGFVKPEAESASSSAAHSWATVLDQNLFAIIFGLIFVLTLGFRLWGRAPDDPKSGGTSRLQRFGHQLSENWFEIIVMNAIGAMISAMVLFWVQQFTPMKMLLGWVLDSVLGGIQSALSALFGAGIGGKFGAWFSWYGQNQLQFLFWFLYLAAICDDLGLPNFKTLGRWLGRRVRHARKQRRSERSKAAAGPNVL